MLDQNDLGTDIKFNPQKTTFLAVNKITTNTVVTRPLINTDEAGVCDCCGKGHKGKNIKLHPVMMNEKLSVVGCDCLDQLLGREDHKLYYATDRWYRNTRARYKAHEGDEQRPIINRNLPASPDGAFEVGYVQITRMGNPFVNGFWYTYKTDRCCDLLKQTYGTLDEVLLLFYRLPLLFNLERCHRNQY